MISAASPGPHLDAHSAQRRAGFDLAHATQTRRHDSSIGGAHGKTIASGARKGREVAVGEQVLGQHQAGRPSSSDSISESVGDSFVA